MPDSTDSNTTELEAPNGVGYVVKRFPRLSETFIINELRTLKSLGTPVEVFSLLPPEPAQQKQLLAELDLTIHYLPCKEDLGKLPVRRHNPAKATTRLGTLRHLLKEQPPVPVDPPFPGKRFSQCATLQMQAAALACMAAMRGLSHLHAHFASDAATVAMMASRLSAIPWSMTAHAKDIYHTYSHPQWDRAFLTTKLLEASFTVTVSDYNKRYLESLTDGRATIHRLYNGVDLAALRFHEGPREQGLIVGVGRLVEKKGFSDLVSACARLHERRLPFRCVIVGDGPERPALEAQIERLGLRHDIELLGALPQPEVLAWLRRATLFALPCIISQSGDRDGLPTVLLEAMALGTPVVSTNVAGIPEMIDDGETGLLTDPGAPDRLADALAHLLGADDGQRAAIAAQARRKAERLFNLQTNVRTLNTLFATRDVPNATYLQTG